MGGGSGRFNDIEERKLAIGEPKRTQSFIESPRQGAGGALHMKTEAAVPHQEGGFVRKLLWDLTRAEIS